MFARLLAKTTVGKLAVRQVAPAARRTLSTATQGAQAKYFQKYLGVEGGVLIKNAKARAVLDKIPMFKTMNNALWAAPAVKWALAIVPLYGALSGNPPVENLDRNQSAALTFTGVVWAYYAMLVRPTAYLLFAVNLALLSSNGYNLVRKVRYDAAKKAAADKKAVVPAHPK